MNRFLQVSLITATIAVSWLVMLIFHESGHVLAAWATGGVVTRVNLQPLAISATHLGANPHPLAVAWGGAVIGCLGPLLVWLILRMAMPRSAFLTQFLAGFCLIGNGAYLAVGVFGRIGDCGDLLRHGAPPWQLIAFGLVTIPAGLACWNGLGKYFGFGETTMRIDRTAVIGMLALLVVLASAMSTWGQPAVDSEGRAFGPGQKRVSLAYLPAGSNVSPKDIPWRFLTHIGHAFLQADEQGNVQPGHGVPNTELTRTAHEHGVRVLISLGGGNSVTAFEKITANPDRLSRYVRGVVSLVDENGYDGVDVDWEFPRSEAGMQGFSALAVALRTALDEAAKGHTDRRRYELTAAISAGEHFGRWLDDQTLRKSFDFLNVMTYDMAGPWSTVVGHHAPLFPSRNDPQRGVRSVEFSMLYWNQRRRIPKEKLCVGIPLYGRLFPVGRPHVDLDPTNKDQHKTLSFSQLRDLSREGWVAKWDHDAKVPWLFAPDRHAIVAFDDRNSVQKKATWARKQGFRGMFFWALPQDRMEDGRHWLVEAAVKAWP